MPTKSIQKIFGNALIALAVAGCLAPACRRSSSVTEAAVEEEKKDSVPAMGFWPDSLSLEETLVKSGETFTGLMTRIGMNSTDAYALATSLDSIFDVRKLRAGNKIKAYYFMDSTASDMKVLQYAVYDRDRANSIIFKTTDPVGAWTYSKPVDRQRRFVDVTIHSSLWNDMIAAGVSPLMIVSLSGIYDWTVDFFGLQEGDRFKAMYTQSVCDGEVIAVDTVHYAEFHRDGKMIPAIRFDQKDGGNKYWTDKGESMRRAFLKAPLEFSRISSGFSYHRKHPVSGKVKAHTAVDYAAPAGTPVRSIGDGTVLSAGWGGGGGNTVKIRHNSTYTTAYLHLSRYASGIKAGAKVKQGQVIGYVGSTGVSTGPHLDFRVWKNGTPINPLKIESIPEAPIRKENLPALDSVYMRLKSQMDSMETIAGTKAGMAAKDYSNE